MIGQQFTSRQLLWFKAVHMVIVNQVKVKLKKTKENSAAAQHLTWRIAYNLYAAGEYEEAMVILETVTKYKDIFFSDDNNITSHIHQTSGRCAVQLFHKTQEHKYLEIAYLHYQNAVETMVINLYTMFKLPLLLLEFGRVLEDYGAFEAANDLYTRILSGFPNFRGYFDALYRSAIVGRHLASLHTDATVQEDALNKCLDILQFLLEALPANISDVRCVVLKILFFLDVCSHVPFPVYVSMFFCSIKLFCFTAVRWSIPPTLSSSFERILSIDLCLSSAKSITSLMLAQTPILPAGWTTRQLGSSWAKKSARRASRWWPRTHMRSLWS
jgi:tetratricopeptide (TPR) repeat protein